MLFIIPILTEKLVFRAMRKSSPFKDLIELNINLILISLRAVAKNQLSSHDGLHRRRYYV
jgi:hypothetical protein